ncbi:MAG: RnfH family protein [Pseudomonadales bacterium]|nr:RnfH family protein [Pseudomonadales bacterium]
MSNEQTMEVEVLYASSKIQKLIQLTLSVGSSVNDAILKSKILESFPEIDLSTNKVGIFGKVVKSPENYILETGARVEIYRPLLKVEKE